MTERNSALSAYEPIQQTAPGSIPARPEFDVPLQVYIIETIEIETRSRRLRQLGLVAALVVGIFVGQWPSAFSSANAVPGLSIGTQGTVAREVSPEVLDRLAFAPSLPLTRSR